MIVPESFVPVFLRLTRANAPFRSAAAADEAVRDQELRPGSSRPPTRLRRDVRISVRTVAGCPVATVEPVRSKPTGRLVYVHGGAWVHEIVPQHWALVARLAAEARLAVIVPVYALLPSGDAAQAHDLVLGLAQAGRGGLAPATLAGDSAGGQIALSVALTLRDRGERDVRTLLIAPALDLTFSNPRIPEVQPYDPWLGVEGGRRLARRWAGGLPLDDPRVSPLAGDLHGLGPMLVTSGTHDILNPDAHLLVDRARAAGVDVTFLERPGALHVHPLLPTRAGTEARRQIVAALRR